MVSLVLFCVDGHNAVGQWWKWRNVLLLLALYNNFSLMLVLTYRFCMASLQNSDPLDPPPEKKMSCEEDHCKFSVCCSSVQGSWIFLVVVVTLSLCNLSKELVALLKPFLEGKKLTIEHDAEELATQVEEYLMEKGRTRKESRSASNIVENNLKKYKVLQ